MEQLPTAYQQYIHLSRYSRFNWDKGRRETWPETVERWKQFWSELGLTDKDTLSEIEQAVLNLEVMPSMRALMTAGPALDRDHAAGYNCSYTPVESPRDLDEIMYILLCGTGVGYSVENSYVSKLPEVAETFHETDTTIVVADSKIGWASATRELFSLLWAGKIPKYDLSRIRPAGAPLRVFGGRASGPEPLGQLFEFSIALFQKAKGRRLHSDEVSDLVCKIAEVVVVGGVRRSALICLCDLEDDRMRNYKTGTWYNEYPQRALANISAVYNERPSFQSFLKEWNSLHKSRSGERGIFSRYGAKRKAEEIGRDSEEMFGTNPCGEIILRPKQFCNLTEVVVRPADSLEDLKKKIRLATILGTLQSTLIDFRYLRKKWRTNCEEERLLGVSLTGICDNYLTNDPHEMLYQRNALEELRNVARETNKKWANKLGILESAAITCVKPSGTVSQLSNSSSGIHPRYSEYYVRRVRQDKKDPLSQFMIDRGFPYKEDVTNKSVYVFSFPVQSPATSQVAGDMKAGEQLNLWSVYHEHYTDHNPSCTVYYDDDTFLEVGDWVWDNFDKITGLSFLPKTDHIYQQAPYEPITKEEYEEFAGNMPTDVDWRELSEYENGEDNTKGSQELACAGTGCEVS